MTCLECHDLVQRLLDGEAQELSPACRQHVGQCSSCRDLVAAARVLRDGLENLPAPVAPPNLSLRLSKMIQGERRIRRRRLHWLSVSAMAASLLIAALTGIYLLSGQRSDNPGPPSIVQGKANPVGEANDDRRDLTKSVDSARQAVVHFSERWADQAREQTRTLLAAARPPTFPNVDPMPDKAEPFELQPAARSLQHAGRDVADSLQPVADTTRRAIAFFFRELPVLERTQ